MAKKRKAAAPPLPRWRQAVLLASVVPMLAGIILFAASWFGAEWIGNGTTQTVTGALIAFLGFALANAAQAKWMLAAAWAMLGVAVWLLVAPPAPAPRWVGGAAGVAGVALVLLAFVERYRQIRSAS
jgi:xanthine/uracil permease